METVLAKRNTTNRGGSPIKRLLFPVEGHMEITFDPFQERGGRTGCLAWNFNKRAIDDLGACFTLTARKKQRQAFTATPLCICQLVFPVSCSNNSFRSV